MIPFGLCLQLWRKERGMSQAALAQKAGVPQPNLSDMERGEREVTLRTLKSLALALEIRPGLLANGEGPDTEKPLVLTRNRLERIARAVVEGKVLSNTRENQLVEYMTHLMKARLRASGHVVKRVSTRRLKNISDNWLSIKTKYRREEIQSLIKRISKKVEISSHLLLDPLN